MISTIWIVMLVRAFVLYAYSVLPYQKETKNQVTVMLGFTQYYRRRIRLYISLDKIAVHSIEKLTNYQILKTGNNLGATT